MLLLWPPLSSRAEIVKTGAQVLSEQGFLPLRGKQFALITNQSAMVGDTHLLALMEQKGVRPALIFSPEHGLKGNAEDGVKLADDASSPIPVKSLYGASRKPRPEDLEGIDLVVFDIQDAGARFYTYISTMGLAMQAAAQAGIPFLVLDRPNPLGGDYVAGFVREQIAGSFTSLYPIPQAHGLTVGELAGMIKGEAMLPDLDKLDLQVVRMQGWQREMRWPDTGLPWVATSPNLAAIESVLLYPGTGLLEGTGASEGRGSTRPFQIAGWPGIDAKALALRLNEEHLPGLHFEPLLFTPIRLPGISSAPKYRDREVAGVSIEITDYRKVMPVQTGVALLAALQAALPEKARPIFLRGGIDDMAGSPQMRKGLQAGETEAAIEARWTPGVKRFLEQRKPYLLY
ncbi:exo-beta-N-acetylmuramidase NamZ family protein [Geomonas azotofigens]|uniref:exo-beta-N-acetylmuramidase NamZ family protein n=1 Tax=Geomonas azotofigens TaxID=2843196 RepID=UPI001F1E4881|nr:DUF1343 domain-containing protein [Geomonas azotofigens]